MACKIFDTSKLSPCKNSRRESVYENFVEIVQNRNGTPTAKDKNQRTSHHNKNKKYFKFIYFLVCLFFFVLFRVDFTHLVLSLLAVVPATEVLISTQIISV